MCSYGLPRVKIHGLVAIYENTLQELPGKPTPLVKDHRNLKNPYLSRYVETLVEKLNNYSFMSQCCCISDLIIFMIKEWDKIMNGSVHEDFYISQCVGTNDRKDDDNIDAKI